MQRHLQIQFQSQGHKIILTLLAIASLSGCLAYRSEGRKLFESRAPANINQNFSINAAGNQFWCWTQPNTDELWTNLASEKIILTTNESGQVEVCTPQE